MDKIFSNSKYKQELIDKAHEYIKNTPWSKCAESYIEVIKNG